MDAARFKYKELSGQGQEVGFLSGSNFSVAFSGMDTANNAALKGRRDKARSFQKAWGGGL